MTGPALVSPSERYLRRIQMCKMTPCYQKPYISCVFRHGSCFAGCSSRGAPILGSASPDIHPLMSGAAKYIPEYIPNSWKKKRCVSCFIFTWRVLGERANVQTHTSDLPLSPRGKISSWLWKCATEEQKVVHSAHVIPLARDPAMQLDRCDCKSEISYIHLAMLQSCIASRNQPISFHLAVTKAGSDSGKLPWETTEEDQVKEASASL